MVRMSNFPEAREAPSSFVAYLIMGNRVTEVMIPIDLALECEDPQCAEEIAETIGLESCKPLGEGIEYLRRSKVFIYVCRDGIVLIALTRKDTDTSRLLEEVRLLTSRVLGSRKAL